MVGRWIAHLRRGKFYNSNIAESAPIPTEKAVAWLAHYLIGISYAVLLVALYGSEWLITPTIGPALSVGVATIIAPFYVLQPGMGAGIAVSRAPNPKAARVNSFLNHAVFGLGLCLSAKTINMAYLV
jgi:hypothetical protein